MGPLNGDSADGVAAAAPLPVVTHHDRDWLGLVFRVIDRLLRERLCIREFSADRHCVVRVAVISSPDDVRLADGTQIHRGEMVGELHLWNEQLPRIPASGPGLGWALAMREQFSHSMSELAACIVADPQFADIRAFRGTITFRGGRGRTAKVARVAAWHGFELLDRRLSVAARAHEFLNGLLVCGLIRAFNPAWRGSLCRKRQHYELWISQRALIERHRAAAQVAGRYRSDNVRRGWR